jgi:cyclin-dependent kinase regulatory subunit CKS1
MSGFDKERDLRLQQVLSDMGVCFDCLESESVAHAIEECVYCNLLVSNLDAFWAVKEVENITYSDTYKDGEYMYRHVQVPRYKPRRLLSEVEWRKLGIQQSHGWENYDFHRRRLLFRRLLTHTL